MDPPVCIQSWALLSGQPAPRARTDVATLREQDDRTQKAFDDELQTKQRKIKPEAKLSKSVSEAKFIA